MANIRRSRCSPRARARAVRAGRRPVGDVARRRRQRRAQEDDPPDLTATPLTTDERSTGDKSLTSRLAETDPALLGRSDATPVQVMIKLDYDSFATYQGGVADLAATSPAVTGDELTGRRRPSRRTKATSAARRAPSSPSSRRAYPRPQVGYSLPHRLRRRRRHGAGEPRRGRARHRRRRRRPEGQPCASRSPTRAPSSSVPTAIYNELDTTADAGAGVIYGNLDTGIWPEHPSFAGPRQPAAAAPRTGS